MRIRWMVAAMLAVCLLAFAARGRKKQEPLTLGLNAEVIALDAAGSKLTVKDVEGAAEAIFGESCTIDCREALESQQMLYVDYETGAVTELDLADLQVGDQIILGLYQSEKEGAKQGAAKAAQLQLDTQRKYKAHRQAASFEAALSFHAGRGPCGSKSGPAPVSAPCPGVPGAFSAAA